MPACRRTSSPGARSWRARPAPPRTGRWPSPSRRGEATQPGRERSTLWTVLTLLATVLLVGVGLLLVAVGQSDDSPGLGGLGLLNALVGVVMAVRRLTGARN